MEICKDQKQVTGKQGFLLKQGHIIKNWKRRFFVLRGPILAYYEDEKDAHLSLKSKSSDTRELGVVIISKASIDILPSQECQDFPTQYCFKITPIIDDKVLICSAQSNAEMIAWIDKLNISKESSFL